MNLFSQRVARFLLLSAAVMAWGCASTPNTLSNAAPGVDFSRYSTFGFLDYPATDEQDYESLETSYLNEKARLCEILT